MKIVKTYLKMQNLLFGDLDIDSPSDSEDTRATAEGPLRCFPPLSSDRATISRSISALRVERVDVSSISTYAEFTSLYRCKRPVIFRGFNPILSADAAATLESSSTMDSLSADIDLSDPRTFIEGVDDRSLAEVLIAKDGVNFLRKQKCEVVQMGVLQVYDRIFRPKSSGVDNNSETEVKESHAQHIPANSNECIVSSGAYRDESSVLDIKASEKVYLRFYLSSLPILERRMDLSYTQRLFSDEIDKKADCNTNIDYFYGFIKKNIGIWSSSEGCVTPLHFDICHGLLYQHIGHKRFLLASPDDTSCMYWDRSASNPNRFSSKVDMKKILENDPVESKAFPSILDANWLVADLMPGDLLYTPPGWWHHVTTTSPSVSILIPKDPDSRIDNLPRNVQDS